MVHWLRARGNNGVRFKRVAQKLVRAREEGRGREISVKATQAAGSEAR